MQTKNEKFFLAHIPEHYLHWTYERRDLLLPNLFTYENYPLEILDIGQPNFDNGPDYLNATLRINGEMVRGDVEFHLDNTNTGVVEMEFAVQFEERGYDYSYKLPINPNERGDIQSVHRQIDPDTGLTFQLKITTLPAGVKLTGIYAMIEGYVPESRDS